MKLTTHLDHIIHCKTVSSTNWSNRWRYQFGGHGSQAVLSLLALLLGVIRAPLGMQRPSLPPPRHVSARCRHPSPAQCPRSHQVWPAPPQTAPALPPVRASNNSTLGSPTCTHPRPRSRRNAEPGPFPTPCLTALYLTPITSPWEYLVIPGTGVSRS